METRNEIRKKNLSTIFYLFHKATNSVIILSFRVFPLRQEFRQNLRVYVALCRLPLSLFHLRKYITGSRPSNKNWVSTFRGPSWTLRAIFLVCLSLGYMDGVKKIGPGNLRPPLANRREGLMPPSPEPPTQQKKKRKNLSFPVLPIDWKYL